MSLCAQCGMTLYSEGIDLCVFHHFITSDEWSASNRAMCDFFHRRKILPRLNEEQRQDPEPVTDYAGWA